MGSVNKLNIILLGAAGFIGTNLVIALAKNQENRITVVDRNRAYFASVDNMKLPNVSFVESDLTMDTDYDNLLKNQDIVYHLHNGPVLNIAGSQEPGCRNIQEHHLYPFLLEFS